MKYFSPYFFYTILLALLFGSLAGVVASVWIKQDQEEYLALLFERLGSQSLIQVLPNFSNQKQEEEEKQEELLKSTRGGIALYQGPVSKNGFFPQDEILFAHGVILTSDGWIVTTVPQDEPLQSEDVLNLMALWNQEAYPVKTVIFDPVFPILFLKIEATDLPVTPFAQSGSLKIGDPLIFRPTQDEWYLSSFTHQESKNSNYKSLFSLAVLPSDHKGGSQVLNEDGGLIGISLSSREILPIDFFLSSIQSVFREGVVKHTWLDIKTINISDIYFPLGSSPYSTKQGIIVSEVNKTSSAFGYLQVNDILLKIDGVPLQGEKSLFEMLLVYKPEDKVEFTILRQNKENKVEMILGTLVGQVLEK